jgi:hypothetical protein
MTKTTNYRSLRDLADAIHAIERSSVIECGTLLLEAKAGHPGEFLAWLAEEFEWSDNTAERWMSVARLGQQFPKLRNLKVGKTTLYALCDLEGDELPPVIARLTKESKRGVLKPAVAQRFIRIEQGRFKYGDRPDATLNALVEFFSEDARSEDVIEALKAANPETDDEAEKIADEARRNAQAERDDAEADEGEAATTKPTVDTKTAPTAPTHNERTAEASAAQRKREYAAKENDEKNDGDAYKPFPDMPFTDIKTIGELQEYIEEALRRRVSRDAKIYIQVDENGNREHPTVHFVNDDGPSEPPFMVVAKGNADDTAEPDITTTTKVERTVFNKALKKARHDLRKVKLS